MSSNIIFMCPLCGSHQTSIVATVADYTVPLTNVICHDCGLVFIHPQPTEEELRNYYSVEFIQRRHQVASVEEARERARKKGSSKKYSIEGLRDGLSSSSRVLEIGCSYGFLLHALQEVTGCYVEGVEPSTVSGAFAMEEFGIHVFTGSVEEYLCMPKPQPFDLIIMYHVLEHLAHPVSVLKALRERLALGGRLYVCVPDVTHLQEPPESFFQAPHLMSFSPWTLHRVLREAGFAPFALARKLRPPKNGMECFGTVGVAITPDGDFRIGKNVAFVRAEMVRNHYCYTFLRRAKRIVSMFLPQQIVEKWSLFIGQCMRRLRD